MQGDRIGKKELISYGMGEAASGVTFGLVTSVLQKYYTDILQLNVLSVLLLFILARFWDAANDPLWGHIVAGVKPDKTGRYRRWVKIFALPLAVCTVLMFVKLPNLSRTGYLIYACVTYVTFGMVYTCLNIPYGSIVQVMTTDPQDRSCLSEARSVGGIFGGVPGLLLISFCYVKGENGVKQMDYSIILIGVILTALLSLLCYFFYYRGTRERIILPARERDGKKGVLFRNLAALMKNKAFLIVSVTAMLFLAGQQFSMSYSAYLFQYYFKAPALTMFPTIVTYVPVAATMLFIPKWGKRYGIKNLCGYGLLLSGIGNVILYLLHTTSPWVYILVLLLSNFGTTFIYLLTWALASEAISDVHEKRSMDNAYAYSVFSFMRKLGHCVAAVLVNMVLLEIGYSGNVLNNANITPAILSKMYMYSVLIPAFLYFLIFALLKLFYPLGKPEGKAKKERV